MCGIVGIVNYDLPAKKAKDFLHQGIIVNSLRGIDGAGVCLVDLKGEQHQYKKNVPGWDISQLHGYGTVLSGAETVRFGLVHNRSGNSGTNTVETAHPINYKHITLIHNGLIHNLHALGGTHSMHDTAAAAMALADKSEKEALELFLGAYALVWYNAIDKTLNMARNTQRPLFIGSIKKSRTLLFASEPGMLTWLASRNTMSVREVSELAPGTHLKISLDPTKKQIVSKFTVATVAPYTPPTYSSSSYYTPMKVAEEFVAEYVGELFVAANKRTYKFKLAKDSMYSWVVDADKLENFTPIMYASYKLRADEERSSSSNCANKAATIIDLTPVSTPLLFVNEAETRELYKSGNEVVFIPETIFTKTHTSMSNFVGYSDDGNFIEVKGFQIFNPIMVADKRYRAKVKSLIYHQSRAKPYVLVEPSSVVELISLPAHTQDRGIQCGWCDADITPREALNNTPLGVSNSGALCDTCMRQYDKSSDLNLARDN